MKTLKNSTRKNSASNNATINRLKSEAKKEAKQAPAIDKNMPAIIKSEAKKQAVKSEAKKQAVKSEAKKQAEKTETTTKSVAGLYGYMKVAQDFDLTSQDEITKYLAKHPELSERLKERSKCEKNSVEYINMKKITAMKRRIKAEVLKTNAGNYSGAVNAYTVTHQFTITDGTAIEKKRITFNSQDIKATLRSYSTKALPEASKKLADLKS